jgi:hypothetical protein
VVCQTLLYRTSWNRPDIAFAVSELSRFVSNPSYVDSDWAGCPDSRRSTSGFVFMLNGAAISWCYKRQPTVTLSSAETEFISASAMVQEVIYLSKSLSNLGFPQTAPTPIFADNETCIAWSEGSVGGSDRDKHVDLRLHLCTRLVRQAIFSFTRLRVGFIALPCSPKLLRLRLTKASTPPDVFPGLKT